MKRQKPKSLLEKIVKIAPGTNPISLAIQTLTSPEEIRQFFEEYAASGKGFVKEKKERIEQLVGTYVEIKQLLHSFSDSRQPYYTDKARQCWDDALCWYQRLVEFASNGLEKEGLWETMPGLVEEGLLARKDVRAALEKHLQNIIPTYEMSVQVTERSGLEREAPAYWQGREREAQEALADLQENKPVKYRGIELAAI